jgi:hypothetical protein
LPHDLARIPRVVFCDRDKDGLFRRFAGLARVRTQLQQGSQQDGAYPPIFVLGLFPVTVNATSPGEQELAALLRWPGLAYLSYGFTAEQLVAAARRIAEGAKNPLPPGILPTAADILRVISEVRHWLENRLRNTRGALIDFRSAVRGDMQLHPAHLLPVAAISSAHRRMLDQLWALDEAAERFVPGNGRIASTKATIAEFEAHWQVLEAARAEIRSRDNGESTIHLAAAVRELENACTALTAAIDATNGLSSEMAASRGS